MAQAQNMDHYKTLGIDRAAPQEEVRAAYRRLALEWHPDVNPSPEAAARMKKINEAKDTLGNPASRARYDRQTREWQEQEERERQEREEERKRQKREGGWRHIAHMRLANVVATKSRDKGVANNLFNAGSSTDPFDVFVWRCRRGGRLLAVAALAVGFAGDFSGVYTGGRPYGITIFPGIAMLATILFVATLPREHLFATAVVGMLGYLVAGAILHEPYEAALFELDRGDAGIRGILLIPALVAVAQLDALLHEHGTITACCSGLILGSLWSKAVFWQEHEEVFPSLAGATKASVNSFTSSALAGVGGYGVGHTAYALLFLVLVGIPFAIVDIFADISLDEDVTAGDIFNLSILLVTGGVMMFSGGFAKLPQIARAVARWRTQGRLTRSSLPAAVAVLVLPIVPAIAMFSLVAFPQPYFEHLMLPLIEWVYS